MTQVEQFKSDLKDLIIKSIEKCLDCLESAVDKKEKGLTNKLRLFWQRLTSLKKHQTNGTMTTKEIDVEMSTLSLGLMNFIDDDLEEHFIIDTSVLMDKTQKEIMVITRPEKEVQLRAFFSKHYFPKVSFIHYGTDIAKTFNGIIILEDMPTGATEEAKMEKYLKDSFPYFLYYGSGFFPRELQNKYDAQKDRVYFANSQFSLYGRLKEFLDYLKYYGK